MGLDRNTFGDSPAANVLADIINERKLRSDKVTNILVSFNSKLRDLNGWLDECIKHMKKNN